MNVSNPNQQKQLYRDARKGKIGGVCAGLAEYFNIEVWLARIIAVTALLLTSGTFVFVAYIAAWLILDKRPSELEMQSKGYANSAANANAGQFATKGYRNASSTEKPVNVKAKVWQAGMPPKQAFLNIQQRFIRSENRLRKLESYVTSKEFHLNREFNRL